MVELSTRSQLRHHLPLPNDTTDWWTQLGTRLGPIPGNCERRLHGCDSQPTLRVGSRCVRGGYRKQNEDKVYADAVHGIFLVADGMGGHHGGAVASSLVVQTVPSGLQAAVTAGVNEQATMRMAIKRSIEAAERRMVNYADRQAEYGRMGATLALVAIKGDTAYITRVGDCRIYLQRHGTIDRLTTDQTYVQAMVDAGALSPAEAHTCCFRNIVTNSVSARGGGQPPVVDAIQLQPGDRLLLATDGLTSVVDDDVIADILEDGSPQDAADHLVLEALRRDSHDNISCVVVKLMPERVHFSD